MSYHIVPYHVMSYHIKLYCIITYYAVLHAILYSIACSNRRQVDPAPRLVHGTERQPQRPCSSTTAKVWKVLRLDLGIRIRVPTIADRIKGVSIAGSGISSSPVLVLEHAFRGIGLYERLQVSNSVPLTDCVLISIWRVSWRSRVCCRVLYAGHEDPQVSFGSWPGYKHR